MGERREPRPEYILCAAIWVDTGEAEPARASYAYPETGLVFAGWRHGDCFTTLIAWAELLSPEERERIGEEQLHGRHQGFLTSAGRYVDRTEAAVIAKASGQPLLRSPGVDFLTSEDVW